ncbi:MAG: ABC transporter permease [Bryobacter sp.]|nr:ABC transporter permease [Bryobacter sp.]
MSLLLRATGVLLTREWLRFWREKARVAGFAAAPLLFWLVVSLGFNDFGRFFTGSIALSLMFAAVFHNMTLIDDRKEGFLSQVLVSPAPRAALVLGKATGAASIATLQGAVFLLFLPVAGFHPDIFAFLGALAVLFLIALVFTLLGFVCAWQMPSTQAFHAVVNLLLLPLWMLSGALFSLREAHPLMQGAMQLNPMTYALSLVEFFLRGRAAIAPATAAAILFSWVAVLLFVAVRLVSRRPHAAA